MALRKDRKGAIVAENASVSLLKDPAKALCLVEALNDLQKSLQKKDYEMVLLSMGPKKKTPQIAWKDGDGDWNFIQGASLLTALINYGEQLTELDKVD